MSSAERHAGHPQEKGGGGGATVGVSEFEGGHPLDRDFALVNAKLAPLVRHGPPPD